jgi:RimJ/RimL family protein N-acetyltransferase
MWIPPSGHIDQPSILRNLKSQSCGGVQLAVVADNVVARCLYASLGFTEYGIEVHSLKVEGRYLDEVLMVKILP